MSTERYLIDTNIFLEVIMDQDRSEESRELLEALSEGKIHGITTKFTVHAVEGILTNKPEKASAFLHNIETSVGIEIADTDISYERDTAQLSSEIKMDFDDSLQYRVAKREGADAVVSFDTDFDSTEIDRKEPAEVLR